MVNSESKKTGSGKFFTAIGVILLVCAISLITPFLAVLFILYVIKSLLLRIAILLFWSTKQIRLLYIYSDGKNWKMYIEQEILPRLPERKIVLNWSERRLWRRFSLATLVFNHYKKQREYNPMAIVIKTFSRARIFRFYRAYYDLKHNKPETLQKIEKEFFDLMNRR